MRSSSYLPDRLHQVLHHPDLDLVLSGGESQRVALGRALASRPGILCLDEPLSNLDEETHRGLCGLLKSVQAQTGVTALHVTHSLVETKLLADKIYQIDDGGLHEVAIETLERRHREISGS